MRWGELDLEVKGGRCQWCLCWVGDLKLWVSVWHLLKRKVVRPGRESGIFELLCFECWRRAFRGLRTKLFAPSRSERKALFWRIVEFESESAGLKQESQRQLSFESFSDSVGMRMVRND